MTSFRARSTDGDDVDDGSTWALAHATIANSISSFSADGDIVYVSDVHAESSSSITWSGPTAATEHLPVVCGDDSADPPTSFKQTATATSTGTFIINGNIDVHGVDIIAATGITIGNSSSSNIVKINKCNIELTNTGVRFISVGRQGSAASNEVRMIDCKIKFASTSHYIKPLRTEFYMDGGSIDSAGSAPSVLFKTFNITHNAHIYMSGVDISHITGSLYDASLGKIYIYLDGCQINSSLTFPTITSDMQVRMTSIDDSTGDNFRNFHNISKYGESIDETGVVLSPSDYSTQINCTDFTKKLYSMFEELILSIPEIVFDSDKTFTIEIVRTGTHADNGTSFDDSEVILIIEAPDALAKSKMVKFSSAPGPLDTPSNLTSSSVSWSGLGDNTSKMSISVTVPSASVSTGPVNIFVQFGNEADSGTDSNTVFIDSDVSIT